MIVCVLAFRVDSLTYTVVKALSYGSNNVLLRILAQERDLELESRFTKMLDSTPQVSVEKSNETVLPTKVGHLFILAHPRLLKHSPMLDAVSRRARKITIISYGDRKRPFRQAILRQWHEYRWYGRTLFRANRVVYKDGFYPIDLFGLFLPRRVIGFDVHSKFLHNQGAFDQIHSCDWEIEARRPVLANFLGSRDPQRRARIVDSIRPYFTPSNGDTLKSLPDKTMFWHEFSDASPAVLGVTEYLDVLSRSDFTVCPPGYSLVTHRPLEALLRGSIPVLHSNELDLYDIGLEDGVNCIAAAPEQWPATIERLFHLSRSEVVAMRRNVFAMIEDRLKYGVSSKRMRIRLGLDD